MRFERFILSPEFSFFYDVHQFPKSLGLYWGKQYCNSINCATNIHTCTEACRWRRERETSELVTQVRVKAETGERAGSEHLGRFCLGHRLLNLVFLHRFFRSPFPFVHLCCLFCCPAWPAAAFSSPWVILSRDFWFVRRRKSRFWLRF